jgi:hypothetical protein
LNVPVCGTVSESVNLPVFRQASDPDEIRWSEGVALVNVNLGARWISIVSLTPWPLYPRERTTSIRSTLLCDVTERRMVPNSGPQKSAELIYTTAESRIHARDILCVGGWVVPGLVWKLWS